MVIFRVQTYKTGYIRQLTFEILFVHRSAVALHNSSDLYLVFKSVPKQLSSFIPCGTGTTGLAYWLMQLSQ